MKSISDMISEKSDKIKGYDKYQVKNAVETLQRAKEIESDPHFMEAIDVEVERQKQTLASITRKNNGYFQPERDGV